MTADHLNFLNGSSARGLVRLGSWFCIGRLTHHGTNHQVTIPTFLVDFSAYLEGLLLCRKPFIITGDFNIHVDVPGNSDAAHFSELLASFNLQQHVDKQTHIHGHTLDLMVTRQSDDIIQCPPWPFVFWSVLHPVRLKMDQAILVCEGDNLHED